MRSHPIVLAQSIGFFILLPWGFVVWALVESARGAANVSAGTIVQMLLLPLATVVMFAMLPLWISRGAKMIGSQQTIEFSDDGIHFA